MGFLSKVFKAPLKIVDTIVDVGTDIVKAPFQVVEDVYQGARNIGSTGLDLVADVGTGVGSVVSGVGAGLGGIGSDPLFLGGTLASQSLAGGAQALLQREQFNQQLAYLRSNPYGNQLNMPEYSSGIQIPGTNVPQLSLSLPSQQQLIPSASVDQTNYTIPLIIGGVGIIALLIFTKGRK